MKLLYLKSYYFPEQFSSSYLGTQTHEAFIKNNIKIELFTPTPSRGISIELRKKYKKIRIEKKYNGMLSIHRFPLFAEGKNVLLRCIRYVLLCIKLFFICIFNEDAKKTDVIMVASTPPIIGCVAVFIKKIRHIPIIYNLQDIFPDSLVGSGLAKKGGFLWRVGRIIENFIYKNSDKIIVISEDFKKNIMAKGVPEEKIEIIYNWVDEHEVFNVIRENNLLLNRYGLARDKFYITYCGNIGLTQNIDLLLTVAEEIKSIKDIQFILIGDGLYKKRLLEILEDKQLKNVKVLPFQPYEEIAHVFSLGDVGLVISKPGVGANSVPSKTWSIMSAERAVIASFDENELKSIIESSGSGIFTKSGDKEALKDAILMLYKDREKCRAMGKNGRNFILENLTKEIGTQKYVDIVKLFNK